MTNDERARIEAGLILAKEELQQLATGAIRSPLEVGFAHGPLTIKDYERYASEVRVIAQSTLAALQAADALRIKPESEWKCKARASVLPEPAECNWPFCGCDPAADKVLEAIEESGLRITKPESKRYSQAAHNRAIEMGVELDGEPLPEKPESEWNEAIESAAKRADEEYEARDLPPNRR